MLTEKSAILLAELESSPDHARQVALGYQNAGRASCLRTLARSGFVRRLADGRYQMTEAGGHALTHYRRNLTVPRAILEDLLSEDVNRLRIAREVVRTLLAKDNAATVARPSLLD